MDFILGLQKPKDLLETMKRRAIKPQTIVVFAYVSFYIKNNVKQRTSYGEKALQIMKV